MWNYFQELGDVLSKDCPMSHPGSTYYQPNN